MGQKINHETRIGEHYYLTVFGFSHKKENSGHSFYNFKCDCGKYRILSYHRVKEGAFKSCGCKNFQHGYHPNKIYDLAESSFRAKASNYKAHARLDGNLWTLSLENASFLLKQDCFYCGDKPSASYNVRKNRHTKLHLSESVISEATIKYNGIDRINNNKGYTKDNVITCCFRCNTAKLKYSMSDFTDWIKSLKTSSFITKEFHIHRTEFKFNSDFSKKDARKILSRIRASGKRKKQGKVLWEISEANNNKMNKFFFSNCFYCNSGPSNSLNSSYTSRVTGLVKTQTIKYNGIDRIDSEQGYNLKNIVPCCKRCNSAKNNLSTEEFKRLIIRLLSRIDAIDNLIKKQ